jgi:outer membrane immunogenic protein
MNSLSLGALASAVIGMAGVASAADMPIKAPYPPASPPASWTGCYLGGEAGGAWGTSNVFDLRLSRTQTNDFGLSGGTGGLTVGCNWQFASNWVVGIENDISLTDKNGSAPDSKVPTTINKVSESWMDTLRGRLGFLWGQFLIYGTGGAAFTDGNLTVCSPGGCSTLVETRNGWVAGGGIEWMFAPKWSAKVEYLHADFGNADYLNISPVTDDRRVLLKNDIVRAGVNLHF